jgi:hypothetical protein
MHYALPLHALCSPRYIDLTIAVAEEMVMRGGEPGREEVLLIDCAINRLGYEQSGLLIDWAMNRLGY